jgi:peptide/nickel transport system substrate-binding protein
VKAARRVRPRAIVVVLLAVLVGAVGANAASASSSDTSTAATPAKSSDLSTDFRLAYTDDIDFQANIFAAYNATPYFIFTEVYDLLLNWDVPTGAPDTKYSPAYKYKVSKDGLTITYWMHPHLKWSDGKPFTSADVVWSYEHAADSNVNSTYTENMKSIKALSPTVVQLKMKRYDARILSAFVPIVPKHIWAPHGGSPAKLTHFNPCCPMVGSGPFVVQSINPTGTSVLVPNKYFYGPRGHVKRILLIKYLDEDAAKRDLELGQIDAINTGKTTWAQEMRKDPNVKLWSSPAPGFDEIAFNSCPVKGSPTCSGPAPNVNVPVVQDVAIRRAMDFAIDRNAIAHDIYNGLYSPGTGIISPFYKSRGYYTTYANDPEINYTYDPEKAHQVLEQGGWKCPPVNGSGTCTKDGHKAEFTLALRSSDSQQLNVGLRIVAWAKAVGIKIDVQTMTEDALNAKIYHSTTSKDPADADKYEPTYDAFMWGWFGDVSTPDYDFEILACGNSSSDSFWCDPKYTALTKKALTQKNFKQRVATLHAAEKLELAASPYVITDFGVYLVATRTDTWTNWQLSPTDGGQPFGFSWVQLQLLKPGHKASSSYAGTTYVIAFLVGVTALVFGIGYWKRRREEHQPFELPPSSEPKAATG